MSNTNDLELHKVLEMADNHLAKGEFEVAQQYYLQALNLQPKLAAALHSLGVITAQYGQYPQAQEYLEAAVDLAPFNAIIHSHLANVLLAQKAYRTAKKHYQKAIQLLPTNPDPYNNLGNLFLKQKKWERAEQAYRDAIERDPYHHDAHYNLGRLYVSQERYAEASEHLMEAYLSIPNRIPTLLALGLAHEKMGAVDKAIHCFQSILKLDPQHVLAQQNLAVCLLSQERYPEAQEHYEILLGLTPFDPMVSYNLAVIATLGQRFSEAINYYKASLRLQPSSVAANTNIANLYLGFGEEDLAIEHFHKVLEVDPNNQAVLFRLGAITQNSSMKTSPKQYIQGLFDYYAPRYDEELLKNLHYQVPQLFRQWYPKLFADNKYRILDLGCGTGLCGEVAKSFAQRLVGIDLSGKMLAQAREKNIYDELIEGDIIEYLSSTKEQFDCVLAGDVLSYYGDLAQLFQEITRIMQINSWFMFTTEHADEPVSAYQLCKTSRYVHNPEYIKALATQYHFTVSHHESINLREQNTLPVRGDLFVLRNDKGSSCNGYF